MTPDPVHSIDLNADLGERFGIWGETHDDALLDVVSSANIACGFHAGDPSIMRATCEAARRRHVRIGAHVGYPDLAGFGRRAMNLSPGEIFDAVVYQLGALQACATSVGTRVEHLKPHGALYHRAVEDAEAAEAIAGAVAALDRGLTVVGPPGSSLLAAATGQGLTTRTEGFADRAYVAPGRLESRSRPGSRLDRRTATAQALELVLRKRVRTSSGEWAPTLVNSICLHGDSADSREVAWAVAAGLRDAGVHVRAA